MNALLLAATEEGFNWHDFIVQALGFAILAVVLLKFVVPVLRKMAGDRSKRIEDEFARLDKDIAGTAQKLSEYQAKLADLGTETQKRIQSAQQEGMQTRANLLAEAQMLAKGELEKALREVQMERDKAVLELRAAVTEMTVTATERVVGAVMSDRIHNRMVDRYLGDLAKAVRQP